MRVICLRGHILSPHESYLSMDPSELSSHNETLSLVDMRCSSVMTCFCLFSQEMIETKDSLRTGPTDCFDDRVFERCVFIILKKW